MARHIVHQHQFTTFYWGQNYGGSITYQEIDGKFVPAFRGIPIRICDQLTELETVVS